MAKNASPVFMFKSDDPELIQAQQDAQTNFKYFWREMTWEYRRIIPGVEIAAVKSAYTDDPNDPNSPVEHMWMNDIEFDGVNLTGTLVNQPNELESVKPGDQIEIPFNQIGDWMYSLGDQVFGAYTVNLMRSRMSSGERKNHDGMWGLNFADPNQIELIPGPAQKKKGFFSRLFGGASPVPKVDLEADHPMSINMGPSLVEALQKNPSIMEPNESGLNMLHSLSLGGSTTGVRILLDHGVDKNVQTPQGLTALQLAEKIGWNSVSKLLR